MDSSADEAIRAESERGSRNADVGKNVRRRIRAVGGLNSKLGWKTFAEGLGRVLIMLAHRPDAKFVDRSRTDTPRLSNASRLVAIVRKRRGAIKSEIA